MVDRHAVYSPVDMQQGSSGLVVEGQKHRCQLPRLQVSLWQEAAKKRTPQIARLPIVERHVGGHRDRRARVPESADALN